LLNAKDLLNTPAQAGGSYGKKGSRLQILQPASFFAGVTIPFQSVGLHVFPVNLPCFYNEDDIPITKIRSGTVQAGQRSVAYFGY
jgi:hypothetical protein